MGNSEGRMDYFEGLRLGLPVGVVGLFDLFALLATLFMAFELILLHLLWLLGLLLWILLTTDALLTRLVCTGVTFLL